MQSRFAGTTSRTFVLAAVFAVAAAAPRLAHAQIADISCDRPGAREVRSLKFEGNTTFKSDELAIHVVTTPSSTMRRLFGLIHAGSARCLPEDGLAPDVANLKGFYKVNGFYATRVDTIVTPLSPDRVGVTFRINEGPPLRADTVTISGLDSVPDRQAVLRDLLVRVGERVGQAQLYADRDSITARLRNQGYPLATVFPSFVTHLGRERAEITLDVSTGPRTRIGTIDVQRAGTEEGREPGIDSAVVLGLLGFRTGNWYSDRALSEATRNLYNLGAYRHVGIFADTAQQPTDTTVRIIADLREDYLRQFQLEEGWGNLDCFKVDAQYTDKNLMNRAWRMDVTGRASKIGFGSPTNSSLTKNLCYRPLMDLDSIGSSKLNYYAGATVRQPTLFGGHWVPAYAAYTERRGEWRAYLRTTYVGLDASATRNIGRQMPFRLGYTLEFGVTEAESAVLCAVFLRCGLAEQQEVQGRKRFAVASSSLQQSRVDNPVAPHSGYSWAAELRSGNPLIGSDSGLSFQKVTADFSLYRPVTRRITFAARARGGLIGSSGGPPPPQERLYAGGAGSDRGFGENELGPLVYLIDRSSLDTVPISPTQRALVAKSQASAARTVPVGGDALVLLQNELRIRDPFFPDLIEWVPFVDAGQLWTREKGTNRINLDRLTVTPGFGVRYFSPVGPIQANAGYNPSKTRAGPAYWAAINSPEAVNSPLLCVTPPGVPLVPIPVDANGKMDVGDNPPECPGAFVPFRSSNFFRRFVFTVSIGASF
jgi:outer membrane protein insertion porin family/translocation and assembly module TamA